MISLSLILTVLAAIYVVGVVVVAWRMRHDLEWVVLVLFAVSWPRWVWSIVKRIF